MQHHLPKNLPDFGKASVLVVGDVMLDRYWFGDTARISPEAPVPIVSINNIDNRPGGAGNVALNIAALGAQVKLLGVTGCDEETEILETQLAAADVNHRFIKTNTLSTIIKLRVISRHQQLIRLDFEDRLALEDNNSILSAYQQMLADINLVVLSDYDKGTLVNPQALILLAKKAGIPVLVDPKGTDFEKYSNADILTPNFKEFEAVVGPCVSEQMIINKGRALLTKLSINALLVTRGENGMTLITHTDVTHFPAYAREVFDVTGAGDTVIATLGASYAANEKNEKNEKLENAAALANLAASLAVGKLGAATITATELVAALTGKTNFMTGIVNEEQLLNAINEIRTQGPRKIVFTNGCYDIIHAGHVTSLQMAKELGDYLVVAVNTDESIQRLKGKDRPVNNLEHRMTVLAGLGVVDWVVPFADDTPERLLRSIRPDLLVKGSDYHLNQIVGAEIVRAYGGEVRIMNHNIKTSSTSILDRLQAETSDVIT